mmetsp:Transcript_17437/g.15721  ORF Transcript_17437/g.15721 Transcript_17437/m.15721 type:complete len:562 (-) Transcript_17437:73-1758(-)
MDIGPKPLPGLIFHSMISNGIPYGIELYTLIVNSLLKDCFTQPLSILSDKIIKSMFEMYNKLQDPSITTKTLKIAEDSAKIIGYYDIHNLKRDDERRLVFEAALIVLFYIGNQRGDLAISVPKIDLYEQSDEFMKTYKNIKNFVLKDCDKIETLKLVHFTNFMKAVLALVPNPKGKRAHMIDLVTRISENRYKKYVTGTGQSCNTQRRVAIYQNESGVAPVPRPPRLKEIAGLILDDNIPAADLSEEIVNYLTESNINDNNNNSNIEVLSYSFPHPSEQNVTIDATELVSSNGNSLVRALSVTRLDTNNNNPTSYEVLRSFSMAALLNNNNTDLTNDLDFLQTIEELELDLPDGLSMSRQIMREAQGVVRGVSVSRQMSNDGLDSNLFQNDMNISDLMRGGSLVRFASGESGLLRSISRCTTFTIQPSKSLGFDTTTDNNNMFPIRSNSFGLTRDFSSIFNSNFSSIPVRSSSVCLSRGMSEMIVRSMTTTSFLEDDNNRDDINDRPNKLAKQDWDTLLDFYPNNIPISSGQYVNPMSRDTSTDSKSGETNISSEPKISFV